MKVSQLITGIALGIATGIQPIFGFNYGSDQYNRVKKTYKLALTSCTLILVVAFFIFQFCPEYIINLFGQESDLYMEFAVKCFRVYLLACFIIGAGAVPASSSRLSASLFLQPCSRCRGKSSS